MLCNSFQLLAGCHRHLHADSTGISSHITGCYLIYWRQGRSQRQNMVSDAGLLTTSASKLRAQLLMRGWAIGLGREEGGGRLWIDCALGETLAQGAWELQYDMEGIAAYLTENMEQPRCNPPRSTRQTIAAHPRLYQFSFDR